MLALGVHLVRGDHRARQLLIRDLAHELAEDRDLVGLGNVHRQLRGGRAVVPDPGQQHRRPAAPRGRAAQRLPVHPQVLPQARALRPGAGGGPGAQRVIVLALIDGAEDPADRGRVRAACPPGPVPRGAQPQEDLFRRRCDPFPGRVQLPVPGHPRDQRQCQQVTQRVLAAPPAAGITDGIQEPEQPRALALIPAGLPRRPRQFPLLRPPAGHRPRQRRGQRRAPRIRQVRRRPGRQRQRRQRRGQHLRDRRHIRHHRRQHLRNQGTGHHGHGRLGHAGFLRDRR
jgi:hypothetical protein